MANKKNHIKKIILRAFIIAAISLMYITVLSMFAYLLIHADSIVRKNISQSFNKATQNSYTLNFENIEIDFRNRKISVNQIHITPSTFNDSITQYTIYTPKLSLTNIRPLPLLKERRIAAQLLDFENPDITLSTGEKINLQNIEHNEIKRGDTLHLSFFQEIFFDTLRISNANLNFDSILHESQLSPEVYLEATHFKIGGRKYTSIPYPFDVSDMSVIVKNVQRQMPDSLHHISVDEIKLSLLTQVINAQNVNLTPNTNSNSYENQFTVHMPKILVKTPMIENLFVSDTIRVESFHILNPSINIKFGSKIQRGTPLNEINLHKLIEAQIKWVDIEHFSVENANLKLIPSANDDVAQLAKNLTIHFFDFRADSTSYKDTTRIMSANKIEAKIEEFTLNHTDQIHRLIIQNIEASSDKQLISSSHVNFSPLPHIKPQTVSTIIETSAISLAFSGVDFHAFYHDKIIPMDMLIIDNPVSTVGIQQQLINKNTPKDKSIILEKTSDYLKGIYVNKTIINDGHIEYTYLTPDDKTGFFSTKYDFDLSDLSIDSVTFYQTDKIFFAENFNVNFTESDLQLADGKHKLNIEKLNLSSTGRKADIQNLKIKAQNPADNFDEAARFDILFPRIQLSGANLHHAFFEKELFIDKLTIHRPVFNIEKHGRWVDENTNGTIQPLESDYHDQVYELISDFLHRIKVNKLHMQSGLLNLKQYHTHQADFSLSNYFSVTLTNFEIDEQAALRTDKLYFSENIDLILKDQAFSLTDGVHKMLAREIGILSSENRVYVKDANIYPDILSQDFENKPLSFFAQIPLLEITNTNIFDLFNHGQLDVDEVKITEPNIKLMFNPQIEHTDKIEQNHAIFLENIKWMNTNKIRILNGNIKLSKYIDKQDVPFAHAKIDFEMDRLALTQTNRNFNYDYSDFSATLSHISFDLPDSIHKLEARSAKYSLSKQKMVVEQLQLMPLNPIPSDKRLQYFEFELPQTVINDFDFKRYLKHKTVEAGLLDIQSPQVTIHDNRVETKGEKISPYRLDLFPSVSQFAERVSVNKISINQASLSTNGINKIQLNNLYLDAKNFVVDENSQGQNRFLNSDETSLLMSNYSTLISGGLFRFDSEEIKINTLGTFEVTGASLKPLVSRDEFARLKRYQSDYFEINQASLRGTNFELQSFIENGNLLAGNFEAEFDSVKIHRDKTYPLNPTQRPPMPQQAIRDLKYKLNIGNALIKANYFQYTELETGASDTSYVFFTNVDAGVTNISNINTFNNPLMKSEINANLMGIGPTSISSVWNLHSFNNEFSMTAVCLEMPLELLNSITEPSLNLSVREGINRRLEASFTANNDSSVGTMRFAYNDLRVTLLNQKDGQVKEEKFISFIVNTLALKSDNPRRGRIIIPSRFIYHRDKQRSIVGYCWQSVYSGIKVSLGMKEKDNATTSPSLPDN